MRYSTAVVLSTLAVGQAAAAHNRHSSIHARRGAKRNNVDWNNVNYDVKNVDWEAIDWKSVFGGKPAAAPAPSPEEATPSPAVTPYPEAPVDEYKPSPAPSSNDEPAESKPSHDSNPIGDIVGDLMQGVEAISSKIGAKIGINAKVASADTSLWIGGDGAFGLDVTNNGDDAVFYCWLMNGFTGMTINVNAPAISVGIKTGQTVQISSEAGVSGACAPATESTSPSSFGGVSNTWAEFTFGAKGKLGGFNVSKNVNMNGCGITMKGQTCTSDMNTCVFECKDKSMPNCEKGTDYELVNCNASNGGGGGYDTVMQGVGGGCPTPADGERIQVSFA